MSSQQPEPVNLFGVLLAGNTPEVNEVQIHQVRTARAAARKIHPAANPG